MRLVMESESHHGVKLQIQSDYPALFGTDDGQGMWEKLWELQSACRRAERGRGVLRGHKTLSNHATDTRWPSRARRARLAGR